MEPTKLKPLKSTQSCAFNGLGELILSNTMTPPTQIGRASCRERV